MITDAKGRTKFSWDRTGNSTFKDSFGIRGGTTELCLKEGNFLHMKII